MAKQDGSSVILLLLLGGAGLYFFTRDKDKKVVGATPAPTPQLPTGLLPIEGCTDPNASNYDSLAEQDNGSCEYPAPPPPPPADVYGCTDATALNYNPNANVDNGSCEFQQVPVDVLGCTNPNADNYDVNATYDDGTQCEYTVLGCTDAGATNFNELATDDDGSCEYFVSTYDADVIGDAFSDEHACYLFGNIMGSTGQGSIEAFLLPWLEASEYMQQIAPEDYNNAVQEIIQVVQDNCNSVTPPPAVGCTDPAALNYDSAATIDNGSCSYNVLGCTDSFACNFDSIADLDDGSCLYPEEGYDCDSNCLSDVDGDLVCDEFEVYGCTNSMYDNYNPDATEDDGTCFNEVYGCTDSSAFNYDPSATSDDGTCIAAVGGCQDPDAENYNPDANYEDGSCTYAPADEERAFLEFIMNDFYGTTNIADLEQDELMYLSPFFGNVISDPNVNATPNGNSIINGVDYPIQNTIDEMFTLPIGQLCIQTGNSTYNGAPIYGNCVAENSELNTLYDEFIQQYDADDFSDPIDNTPVVVSSGTSGGF